MVGYDLVPNLRSSVTDFTRSSGLGLELSSRGGLVNVCHSEFARDWDSSCARGKMLSPFGRLVRVAATSVIALLFFVVFLHQPGAVQSNAIAVQHAVGPTRKGLGHFYSARPGMFSPRAGSVQARMRASEWLFSQRFDRSSPIKPRALAPSAFDHLRGRKLKSLYGSRGCASEDLTLTQGAVSLTSGIPTFSVQIINLCGDCAMGAIHVACGNWASATLVDPDVFLRLGYNNCLVNGGKPLSSQGMISFQYSNSAMYPMSITSARSECPA